MKTPHESTIITYSDDNSLQARAQLFSLLRNYPATDGEAERSLGLFLRGSLLARIFAIRELYEKILMKPGIVVDLGTWRGQTAVLCENLRAILEPLHFNRRIVCFDTFQGYCGFSQQDKTTELHKDGTYRVEPGYAEYLNALLVLHEKNNAMGHNHGKHRVVQGDCRIMLPQYLSENPHEVIALAFFDLNSFEPTEAAFHQIYERLIPGGIVGFWQLTRSSIPAEGKVYNTSILNRVSHSIYRTQFYPGLCYLIKD
jgi:hypothetical protein